MMYHHTRRCNVGRSKVAITIDEELLQKLDRLVRKAVFRNRSQAIQIAVREKLERVDQSRLARECSKLDPKVEKALAEEGLSEELREWPEY
jgi:Arc/MetJ-type ribon-helix-helix transcriptional regulator